MRPATPASRRSPGMDVMDAIYGRRAVRAFETERVGHATIDKLIDAAIHAPSAMNLQPWSFQVIEGSERLAGYSQRAKRHFLSTMPAGSPAAQHTSLLEDPHFNIFYGAPTLIIVCATPPSRQAEEDCCLAAQNLMLAAHGLRLGTCWIGFSRPWLELEATRAELGIDPGAMPVAPIIVGFPAGQPAPTQRRKPVVRWLAPS